MKWMESDPEHELIEAVSRYLEIVEEGGDGAAYLRTLGPLAPSVREIVGIGDKLKIDVPGPTPEEVAQGRRELFRAITTAERRRAATGPKLFGVIAAAGLGLGLGAAFASGAVPTPPFSAMIETIPFVGADLTPGNGRNSGHPVVGSGGTTEDRNVTPFSSPTSEPSEFIEQGQPELPPTPASENGRGIGATGTPPGQGGTVPGGDGGNGAGVGSGGTPPGQGGENPGNGVGNDGTPPGQGGENPGNAGGNGNGVGGGGTPPGQGGENPGQGIGGGVGGGTPPGQGGENPGQGAGGGDGNSGNGNGNGGGDGSAGGGNGNGNNGNGNGNGGGDGSTGGGNGNGNNGNGNGNGGN